MSDHIEVQLDARLGGPDGRLTHSDARLGGPDGRLARLNDLPVQSGLPARPAQPGGSSQPDRTPVDILLSLDDSYAPHARTLLFSLHVNNPGERFRVFLMHDGICEGVLDRLAADVSRLACELVPIQVGSYLFGDAPASKRYPQTMYYRLIAHTLLPKDCRRVLYLDPDMLVINPIRPLWDVDLGRNLFAAAAHSWMTELPHSANKMRLDTEHHYFNTGMLLIDVDAARGQIYPRDVMAYVREHQGSLVLPDQDVFNALFGYRTLEVPDILWNFDARHYGAYRAHRLAGLDTDFGFAGDVDLSKHFDLDMDWIVDNTAILHFCGKEKPWQANYRYRFGVLYKHYAHQADRLLGAW